MTNCTFTMEHNVIVHTNFQYLSEEEAVLMVSKALRRRKPLVTRSNDGSPALVIDMRKVVAVETGGQVPDEVREAWEHALADKRRSPKAVD